MVSPSSTQQLLALLRLQLQLRSQRRIRRRMEPQMAKAEAGEAPHGKGGENGGKMEMKI